MAFVSFKKDCRFSKILSLSLIASTVTACSQTNPAEIRDLSGSSSTRIYSESSYEAPPANIVKAQSSVSSKEYNDRINSTTKENITYNRNYEAIPKGGYSGNTYTVKKGDTLFYIAWITGNDVRSLATKNHISEPYDLSIGQVLDVNGNTNKSLVKNKVTTKPVVENRNKPTKTITKTEIIPANPSNSIAKINWQWPVKGKIIQSFSNESKGIDIQGSLGQRVNASADGTVVYAGNALAGYGNLIIIKHNDDYLTAYAHNQSILVKEQQEVKSGQQIATMGNTGTNSVRLHFEIRYKVKSVDPINYLPK